ncbi:MAG: ABC transporter ATP-binding protein [Lentimicrobiaceae bacterium]|nr:ABC transporter ATP-binding protein [Lentimicrobiaceae bacterium]
MADNNISVSVKNVDKNYGKVNALQNINLEVSKGELFGCIGPDGAGKTTLFRILTTLLLPNAGTCSVEGWDVVKNYKEIRKIVGYMPGRFSLYPDLSVEENLRFFASAFHTTVEENYSLIRDIYVQIEPFKKRKAAKLSGGMKQKLALSCALIHKPLVLFLDEPTTGVDAVSRKEFWEMLKKLKSNGITIFVSTPYMDEASLCDRVALIQKGKILIINTPDEIMNKYGESLWAVKAINMYRLLHDLRLLPGIKSAFAFGDTIHLSASANDIVTEDIIRFCQEKNHTDVHIQQVKATIEDCFMALMRKE